MDCGPACLQMVARYYGRFYTLQTLRNRSFLTRSGVSMLGITRAAESIGFECKSWKCTWKQFLQQGATPCIVHWGKNHFVVVYGIRHTRKGPVVRVADPAFGRIEYLLTDFLRRWQISPDDPQGIVLRLEPTEAFFAQSSEAKSGMRFRDLYVYLKSYRPYFLLLLALMGVGSLISLIFPFLTQALVDRGIGNADLHIVALLFIAQLMLTLGQLGNDLVSNFLMLHVANRISISFLSDFLSKLMRLPISFFDIKRVGDILQRISDNRRIQTFLTGSLISIVVAGVTFVVYTVVMASYNLTLLGIFVLGSVLYVLWVLAFLRKRRELDFKRFQESALNQSYLVQMVDGMQEIKLNACEKRKRWEWERIQVKLFQIGLKSLALGQSQQVGGVFINQVKNIVISFVAAKAVIDQSMTLGMMMAVQYVLGQLNAPLAQFIGFMHEAQDARISLERLGEVYNQPDEEPADCPKINQIPASEDIRLQDVGFQYEGPDSEWVLKDVDLTIGAGQITAIVGSSGSGKTTLIKLLLGFYPPSVGTILLGRHTLGAYSERAWRKQCGVVMQEGYIFSDTLAHNIAVVDDAPDWERMKYAVQTAHLDDFVTQLPLGFQTPIGSEGSGLSTGQRQRILIARAVYKNPKYIFLDEATNALDATNETIIMRNLRRFYKGKTVVVVAHRLSTVKHTDKIVVLEQGRIVENGTHPELVAKRGCYYKLIKDQLELGN